MKRLSRHTVVVLLVALLSSVAGLTLAVVAFGQGDGSSTVPTSAYTTTTGTTPLSPYTTTPATTPTTPTTPTKTSTTEATTTNGSNPERDHGRTVPKENGGPVPSKETRKGPSHLAFTGAEPIYLGLLGAALMAGGLMLHRRRRASTDR